MFGKLEFRVNYGCRFQICSQIPHKSNIFADIQFPVLISSLDYNKLTPHGMSKNHKFSPKLMLTLNFRYLLISIPNLVNKWHNLYMDIWRWYKSFCPLSVCFVISSTSYLRVVFVARTDRFLGPQGARGSQIGPT